VIILEKSDPDNPRFEIGGVKRCSVGFPELPAEANRKLEGEIRSHY
jgi:hypothetical protein